MPLSHITLTVSHLPTSTSFFLSCLQPLGYRFVGRHDNHVGFGSVEGEPADFWISEERPGVPAGAAHVAFPAPSRNAVSDFFIAALKAGGKIHGEPAVRDSETRYYSAAVIDFDGNSIEAVHRPSSTASERSSDDRALTVIKNGSVVSKASSTKTKSLARPKSEVGSTVSKARTTASHSIAPPASQVKQPALQSEQTPAPAKENSTYGAKAIVGTLIGAAAGAAVAYAMVKGDSQSGPKPSSGPQYIESSASSAVPEQESRPVRAIEAPPDAQSTFSKSNGKAYSEYARSVLSKNPRASTIMEGLENCSRIWGNSHAGSEFDGGRRSSDSSAVDLPLRTIEAAPIDEYAEYTYSRPNEPSTFISSFRDKTGKHGHRGSTTGHSITSGSTIKPTKSRQSHSSHSILTINDLHSSKKASTPTASFYSAANSARNIPLPSGSVTTISASKRHSHLHHHTTPSTRSSKHPRNIALPPSVSGAITIFLDGGVDIDSHVLPPLPPPPSEGERRRSHHSSHHSRRSKSSARSSKKSSKSKFDEPVKPSDSVSQVSTNVSTSKRSGRSSRR